MNLELSLNELIGMVVRKAQREAWDSGWRAHFSEHERERSDPSHPITRENPYE